jgi:hypothetical protein
VTCEECGVDADERAEGWQAHRADWPGEEPQLVVYCPLCAEREFGFSDGTSKLGLLRPQEGC